ncbi:MAG: hypothetical protein RLZZ136_717 [Pseudomonadota bacterium]|jgi:hypothetical protein
MTIRFSWLGQTFAAIALIATLPACSTQSGADSADGQKLAALDMSGDAPDKIVLSGPDHLVISEGPKLTIAIDGSPQIADRLRFTLADGTLSIARSKAWRRGEGLTIRITMPPPTELTLAGPGTIETATMGRDGAIIMAGSGEIHTGTVSGKTIHVTIAGSGLLQSRGAIDDLEMNLAGSGTADLAALRVNRATVTLAGSGSADLNADNQVSAQIVDTGIVRVKGRAACTAVTMGTGKLICESGPTQATSSEAQ